MTVPVSSAEGERDEAKQTTAVIAKPCKAAEAIYTKTGAAGIKVNAYQVRKSTLAPASLSCQVSTKGLEFGRRGAVAG